MLALLEEVTLYDGRLPALHARHERVPGAGGEGGRSGPHQLAPLHPREADPERGQGGHWVLLQLHLHRLYWMGLCCLCATVRYEIFSATVFGCFWFKQFQQGLISLPAAQIELDNFKRHVIPVAEFFDTKQVLHLVSQTLTSQLELQTIHRFSQSRRRGPYPSRLTVPTSTWTWIWDTDTKIIRDGRVG